MLLNDGILQLMLPSIDEYINEFNKGMTFARWAHICNLIRRVLGYDELPYMTYSSALADRAKRDSDFERMIVGYKLKKDCPADWAEEIVKEIESVDKRHIKMFVEHLEMLKRINNYLVMEEFWEGKSEDDRRYAVSRAINMGNVFQWHYGTGAEIEHHVKNRGKESVLIIPGSPIARYIIDANRYLNDMILNSDS